MNEEGLRDTFKELKKNGKSINFKEFKSIAFKSFGESEEGDGDYNKTNKYENEEIEDIEEENNNFRESIEIEEIREDRRSV